MAAPQEAINEASMLALSATQGDFCIRTDLNKTYRLTGLNPAVLAHWTVKGLPSGTSIYTDSVTGRAIIARTGEENGLFATETGPVGPTGAAGATGPSGGGPPGPDGPPGEDGEPGPPGPTGPAGTTGAPGTTGATGADGRHGVDGVDGEDGLPGPMGPQGLAGATGSPGGTGSQGPIGPPIFLVADPGEDGEPGRPGPTGPTGPAGTTGAQGPMGPTTHLLMVDDDNEPPPMMSDQNKNPGTVATPAVPASTVAVKNATGRQVTVYIKAGTLTVINVGGTVTGIAAAAAANMAHSIPLAPNQTIAITYSVAPTWVWVGGI